jgi:hypothetical protein
MSGNSLLIDTNIALYLLNGDEKIADLLDGRDVNISFITELELLGYQDLASSAVQAIEAFINDCIIIELNQSIKEETVRIKRRQKMKLPDAIIAASSNYITPSAPPLPKTNNYEIRKFGVWKQRHIQAKHWAILA